MITSNTEDYLEFEQAMYPEYHNIAAWFRTGEPLGSKQYRDIVAFFNEWIALTEKDHPTVSFYDLQKHL